MHLRALSLLVVATTSCSLASSESPTGEAKEALFGQPSVMYFGDRPVAMVRVLDLGGRLDLAVVGVLDGQAILGWIQESLDKKHSRKDGAIVSGNFDSKVMRPFVGFDPIDIIIASDGVAPKPIHVVVSGDLQHPRPTNLVLPQLPPVGTGLPTGIRVGCGGLPEICARVSDVRLAWHAGDTVGDLVFRASDPQELSFDPNALGAVDFVGVQQVEQTQILFSLALPAARPVFFGPVVVSQQGASRTLVLRGETQ